MTEDTEFGEHVVNSSGYNVDIEADSLQYEAMPAGFWIRVAAALIDGMVFLPVLAVSIRNLTNFKSLPIFLLTALPSFLYKPLMEWRYGATLGKMAMGVVVIDKNGHLLTLAKAYLRFLPNLLIGILSLISTLFIFSTSGFEDAGTIEALGKLEEPVFVQFFQWPLNMFALVDCLAVAFTQRKRAIHDFMAGSYCVISKTLIYKGEDSGQHSEQ